MTACYTIISGTNLHCSHLVARAERARAPLVYVYTWTTIHFNSQFPGEPRSAGVFLHLFCIDRLTELWFYVPFDTTQVILEMFPKPISWFGMETLNLTQHKYTFTNQKKCTTTQNKHKKISGIGFRLARCPSCHPANNALKWTVHVFSHVQYSTHGHTLH